MDPLKAKREHKRSNVLLDATICTEDGRSQGKIRDLSNDGALLESDIPQTIGAEVVLLCDQVARQARVAWVDGLRFGVDFQTPLTSDELDALVGSPLRVSATKGYRRDSLDTGEDTAAEPDSLDN